MISHKLNVQSAIWKTLDKNLLENDKEGLRLVRETAVGGKKKLLENTGNNKMPLRKRLEADELAEWLHLWIQSPEIFDNWVTLRLSSKNFKEKFGE